MPEGFKVNQQIFFTAHNLFETGIFLSWYVKTDELEIIVT